jgi:hypothetical protein
MAVTEGGNVEQKTGIGEILTNPSVRRFGALLLGPLVAGANRKWNLGLEVNEVLGLFATIITYVVMSNHKEAVVAKAEAAGKAAAAKIDSPAAAVAVLNEAAKP